MQRVKCRMSFLASLPCYISHHSSPGTCWTCWCPASLPLEMEPVSPGWFWRGADLVVGLTLARWVPLSCGLGGKVEGHSLLGFPSGSMRPCCHASPCTFA